MQTIILSPKKVHRLSDSGSVTSIYMPNMPEHPNHLTPAPAGTHYSVKHHLQTISITKNFMNNLRY